MNVINVIKHWIRYYSTEDFVNNPELLQKLQQFSQHVGDDNKRLQQQLLNITNKKLHGPLERQKSLTDNDSVISSKAEITSINSDLSINSCDIKSCFKSQPTAAFKSKQFFFNGLRLKMAFWANRTIFENKQIEGVGKAFIY